MKFTPKTESELSNMNLWPAGNYGFEVLEYAALGQTAIATDDDVSKNGNDMIRLVLNVFNDDGQSRIVIDYLLESTARKLHNAAYACGLENQYKIGELSAKDFIGKEGNLKLYISKDKSGKYGDKNAVADYLIDESRYQPSPAAFIDDDIPFN